MAWGGYGQKARAGFSRSSPSPLVVALRLVLDRCVRARMREVSALDEQFFAGVRDAGPPAPGVAGRVVALGGGRNKGCGARGV